VEAMNKELRKDDYAAFIVESIQREREGS